MDYLGGPRKAPAARAAAPVIISGAFLDSVKQTAMGGKFTATRTAPLEKSIPADVMTYRSERIHKLKEIDAVKHATAAAHIGSSTARAVEDEERRMAVQESARPALKAMREAKTESMSEVQELNHKVAKARVMGSWSKQLEIKAAMKAAEELSEAMHLEEARRRDVRALQEAAAGAAAKRESERKAAEVIAAQLEERAYHRELALEAVELDAEQMKRTVEARARAEEAVRRKADEEARAHRAELVVANDAAIRRKAERAAQELEAEHEVMRHMLQKAAMERARILEGEHAKREKEHRAAEMLAKQQKALDKRGAEDEKRARVHEETVILRERAREKGDRARREALMSTVMAERTRQLELKQQRVEEEAAAELELLRAAEARDVELMRTQQRVAETKREASHAYKSILESQLSTREEERKAVRSHKYEDRLEMERAELRRARALREAQERKIAELRAEGVTDAALRATGLL